MAETEVVSPPPVPLEEPVGKDAPEKREGKPERPRRELEDIPEMTVDEAQKALNALPKAEVQPNNEDHEKKVAAINEEIKKIKDQIEVLRTKIDGANEARRGQGDEMGEARSVMRTLKEERDEIRGQLDAMQADSARAKAALDGHDKSRRALQSSLKYKTVVEIETAIRQMESRQQTSSMSLAEEKKLIKEMEQLKQSKKTAAQYVSHEEAVGKAKDGYGAARKTESEKKAELRVIHEKLKVAFTVLEEMGKAREEEGGGVNTLFEEKKALHEEINVKIEEIKEMRGTHRAKLDQWYNSKRERMKLKKALSKAEYLERQAVKIARNKAFEDEEAKKIPYESEMVLCDTLVSYLETTFMKETPKTAATAAPSEAANTEEFGGIKMVMKKRQNEEFIVGGKKKGGGKRKSGGKNAPGGRSTIVHAIDTMESFSMLAIAPPPNKAAVPGVIKALKLKKTWFSEQPRQPMTAGKPAQATEKAKKAPKVKAPDINDEEFPGLPGMAKPKAQEASEDSDGEKANGAGEDGEDGGEDNDAAEGEKVAPPTAASIVANGVNGVAKPEADAPALAATSSDEPADAATEAPEAGAQEDGAEVPAEAAATAASDDDADAADTKKVEAEQKTDSPPAAAESAADCAKPEAAEGVEKEAVEEGGGEDKEEAVEETKAGAEEAKDGGKEE